MSMENFETNKKLIPETLVLRLKNHIAPMPEVLRDKYMFAITCGDIEVLIELSEKIRNKIAYEQEKSEDRCSELKDTLNQLDLWLDIITK